MTTAIASYKVAIITRYIGPTNFRGSRVKADAGDKRTITVSWDYGLNSDQNHAKACEALCRKMKWDGKLVGGSMEHGWAWVFVS